MKSVASGGAPQRVVVVDYGMGNLRSVAQAVRAAAADSAIDVQVSADPQAVRDAQRVVLPGQGAMPDCMAALDHAGLRQAVLDAARSKPLFGVCVGMQMLFEHSQEGPTDGLGLLGGDVLRFDLAGRQQPDGSRYKVPQMGWNAVQRAGLAHAAHPVWAGVPEGAYFYFVHSYYAVPTDACDVAGLTDYGAAFCCAVARDNIFATQFHPEKSAAHGLALYRNFLHWNP